MRLFIALFFLSIFGNTLAQTTVFDHVRNGDTLALNEIFKTDPTAVNKINSRTHTPLIIAAYRGKTDMVKYLISRGADVNIMSNEGTALHGAAYKGEFEIATLLLKNGAEVNVADENGTTALIYATLAGHTKLAILLVDNGADASIQDQTGRSAMDYAKALDNQELLKRFNKK